MIGDLAKGIREVLILTERVDGALDLARQADKRSLENRERIVRMEAILEIALKRQPKLPGA